VIGLDTSHAPAFAKLLNDPKDDMTLAGCKVVAAYPKGSPDIESSTSRVAGYVAEYEKLGIEIVNSIPALIEKVDCVLLETNDGRPHLEQALPVLKAGKTCFIDKPIAGSLTDAVALFEASKHYKTPIFSSSSLRYAPTAQEARAGKFGDVLGCDVFSPASLESTHPDLFWYGIHGVEMLFTAMGTGCESVTRAHTPGFDVVVGTWSEGRIGTMRGIREPGKSGYGGHVFGSKANSPLGPGVGYKPLVVDIVKFFKAKHSPVAEAETLEIYAFMEAADESKRRGGVPVKISEVLDKARADAAKKLEPLLK
jgi:predicted dehydrogenase